MSAEILPIKLQLMLEKFKPAFKLSLPSVRSNSHLPLYFVIGPLQITQPHGFRKFCNDKRVTKNYPEMARKKIIS
jgi:hypothetical protein